MKISNITFHFRTNLLVSVYLALIFSSAVNAQESQRYLAVHKNAKGAIWIADLTITGNRISGHLGALWEAYGGLGDIPKIPCKKGKVKSNGRFKIYCKTQDTALRSLKGTTETAKLSAQGQAGGADFKFITGTDIDEFLKQRQQIPELTTDKFPN